MPSVMPFPLSSAHLPVQSLKAYEPLLENRDKKGRRLFAQCNQRNEAPQDGRYSRQDRIEVRPFVPNPKGFSAVKQEKFIYGHTFLSY